MLNKKTALAFTLIEVLLVVAAIAILAGITILAINPSKQLATVRDNQRTSNVKAIMEAIGQYNLDNPGTLPAGIDASWRQLGTAASGCTISCGDASTTAACLDIASSLTPKYLVSIPFDPSIGSTSSTGYAVRQSSNGRIYVRGCNMEQSSVLEMRR